jgi:hypothetical protein
VLCHVNWPYMNEYRPTFVQLGWALIQSGLNDRGVVPHTVAVVQTVDGRTQVCTVHMQADERNGGKKEGSNNNLASVA